MSILEVKNLSHGFGDRAILKMSHSVCSKGEHIGLVGANGEGESQPSCLSLLGNCNQMKVKGRVV